MNSALGVGVDPDSRLLERMGKRGFLATMSLVRGGGAGGKDGSCFPLRFDDEGGVGIGGRVSESFRGALGAVDVGVLG